MIGRLVGVIAEREPDGSCIVDVQGIGYQVSVPLPTLTGLPTPPESTTLHIHTHVREEVLALYGFASTADRAAFRMLLNVSSIGPKLAMAIMHHLDAKQLRQAIAQGDKARFKGIAGVGKKTVDRIILELKDKLGEGIAAATVSAPGIREPNALTQVAEALIQMGYKRGEAMAAIEGIAPNAAGKGVETLLREALAALA